MFYLGIYQKRSKAPLPLVLPAQNHFMWGHAKLFELGIMDSMRIITQSPETIDGVSCFYLAHIFAVSVESFKIDERLIFYPG